MSQLLVQHWKREWFAFAVEPFGVCKCREGKIMVGSAKLRTGAETDMNKNVRGLSRNARKAKWGACAAMLTTKVRHQRSDDGYNYKKQLSCLDSTDWSQRH